jgi:acetoin utilization deacetylase AcuC-like enzyme
MHFGYNETALDHDTGSLHPESADRVDALVGAAEGWSAARVSRAAPAPRQRAATVHDDAYLDDLAAFCAAGGGTWTDDTVACGATMDAALASAGTACWAVDRALEGPPGDRTPFGLCRPPGHHALADDAMGFCFLNNAAIAAEHGLRAPGVDSVAVVDWDVHHGNGTEAVFAGRDDVLYASVHERGLFPEPVAGRPTGEATLSVGLPGVAGDPEYVEAFDSVVAPRVDRFDPDLLLVSAGFDASEDDHTSRVSLSADGFGYLASLLEGVASGTDAALSFLLEGGYQLRALREGVRAVQEALAGAPPAAPTGAVDSEVAESLAALRGARVPA